MKKLLSLIVIAIIFTSTSLLHSEQGVQGSSSTSTDFKKVGAAGSQFLKIGVGGRATGMAGAYGALADDLSAMHWNPAGLVGVRTMSAAFNHTQWFADWQHNFAAFAMPMGKDYTLGVNLVSFNSGEIPVTTMEQQEGTGNFYTVQDVAMGVTFSGYLTEQFSFGITGKLVYNSFASLSTSAMAFDIGTMYDTGIYGIKLGFSIHNLGTQQEYSGQDLKTSKNMYPTLGYSPQDATYTSYPYNMPITFRAGISTDIYKEGPHFVKGAVDFVTLSDTPEQFAFGVEYGWNDFLFIRSGYLIGHDQFGFAGGIGLKYMGGGFGGQFDYSLNPTSDIGLIHRIGVSMNFGD